MQRNALTLALSAALSLGLATLPGVTSADTITPVAGEAIVAKVSGTIAAIDLESRLFTVQTPDGKFEVFHIPAAATRADQVKIGDHIEFTETEAMLVDIEKGRDAGAMARVASTEVDKAPGDKPAGTITEKLRLFGKVEKVDRAKGLVTVKGAERTLTLAVPDKAILDQLKAGDGVIATYVRSITGKVTVK